MHFCVLFIFFCFSILCASLELFFTQLIYPIFIFFLSLVFIFPLFIPLIVLTFFVIIIAFFCHTIAILFACSPPIFFFFLITLTFLLLFFNLPIFTVFAWYTFLVIFLQIFFFISPHLQVSFFFKVLLKNFLPFLALKPPAFTYSIYLSLPVIILISLFPFPFICLFTPKKAVLPTIGFFIIFPFLICVYVFIIHMTAFYAWSSTVILTQLLFWFFLRLFFDFTPICYCWSPQNRIFTNDPSSFFVVSHHSLPFLLFISIFAYHFP